MWRWRVLLVLVVLCTHTTPQPLADDSSNGRNTRQSDFKECCPCVDGERDPSEQELAAAASERVLSRAPLLDDCPCRPRDADAQGAASVFFPTAMRTAGSFLRPGEKNENLKPLFNPEVDLASSVLNTLREATDEEYRDALSRDAAKNAVKAAEDILFEDASPQESADIVTIVVNPADDDDDVIPMASHIQQSRCIHPLQRTRTSFNKMRLATKPRLLLHKPRLPKTKFLHRRLYDMDSGVGASNLHERIVSANEDTEVRKNTSPLRISTNEERLSQNKDSDEHCNLGKVPNFQPVPVQNKFNDFDLSRSTLLKSIRDKTINPLSRIPKLRFSNLLPKNTMNNDQDLNPAPSTLHEQASKKVPSLRINSHLDKLKQQSSPLSVSNLLNLRDVELIPLRDLMSKPVHNKLNTSKQVLPSLLSRMDTMISDEKDVPNFGNWNKMQSKSGNNALEHNESDPASSPSLISVQVSAIDGSDNECEDEISQPQIDNSANDLSTKILDSLPNSQDKKADCFEDKNTHQDLITDANNNVQESEVNEEEKLVQEENHNDNSKMSTERPKLKMLDSNLIDKTVLRIKENIARKIDDIKSKRPQMIYENRDSQETISQKPEIKDDVIVNSENQNLDCHNEASMQDPAFGRDLSNGIADTITTTFMPYLSDDNFESIASFKPDNDSDNTDAASQSSDEVVSLQDLQEISDSMLQQEERERQIKSVVCSQPLDQVKEEATENNNRDSEWIDLDNSANTMPETVMEAENSNNFEESSSGENACKSDWISQKSSLSPDTDTNAEASNTMILENARIESETLEPQSIPLPSLNFFKKSLPEINEVLKLPPLDPLPTLDDIKVKLTNLFHNKDRTVDDFSPTKIKSSNMLDGLNPIMATDASTGSFQSRLPPSKLLGNVNFDILELPQSSLFPNIPKLGLHSYQTKIPLPKELSLKPMTFQSALEDKYGLLGTSFSIGENRKNTIKNNFRNKQKATGVLNNSPIRPRLNHDRERFLDLPFQETKNIHSTLRNTQKTIENRLRNVASSDKLNLFTGASKSPTSLLETISRNHEDVNDKLRALHVDFNDRIETMRNELIDRSKLLTSGSRNMKQNFGTSSNISKQKKDKKPFKQSWHASSRRESQKALTPRRQTAPRPVKIKSSSKQIERSRFSMPAAASVPVPRTVQVPELKLTSVKSLPLTSGTLGKQASNLQSALMSKQFIKPKESKIKVSFSTTPRPLMLTGNTLRNSLPSTISTNREKLGSKRIFEDHNVSPSEIQAKVSTPVSIHLNRHSAHSKIETTEKVPIQEYIADGEENLHSERKSKQSNKIAFQSWPRATESAFLAKVKEAVQSRLSEVHSPLILRRTRIQTGKTEPVNELIESKSDMARSASENNVIMAGPPLEQNVTYKCKMVCNKD